MNLLLSPHDDDQHLFASFTCIRERPLVVVVTDSYIQPNRGEKGCSAKERHEESRRAGEIFGCPLFTLGLRDDDLTEGDLQRALSRFSGFDTIYAPAIQGGNWQHDLVGTVAGRLFESRVRYYTTYNKEALYTMGTQEIKPTQEEIDLKNKALDCYQSQINLGATAPHFWAVRNKSEWYL